MTAHDLRPPDLTSSEYMLARSESPTPAVTVANQQRLPTRQRDVCGPPVKAYPAPVSPPRPVEVEHEGQWYPVFQSRWLLCDDDRGWMAQVEYTAPHDWGRGKHLESVPPARLRMAD